MRNIKVVIRTKLARFTITGYLGSGKGEVYQATSR
jgi:hypothetical protein